MPDAVSPPAGCRFYPRCPEAFASCGWEPRDLRDQLEAHLLDPEVAQVLRSLDDVHLDGQALRIRTKEGNGKQVASLLQTLVAKEGPLVEAMLDLSVQTGEVVATFRDPVEPWDLVIGGRMVNCHLFDPDVVETPRASGLVSWTPAGSEIAELGASERTGLPPAGKT